MEISANGRATLAERWSARCRQPAEPGDDVRHGAAEVSLVRSSPGRDEYCVSVAGRSLGQVAIAPPSRGAAAALVAAMAEADVAFGAGPPPESLAPADCSPLTLFCAAPGCGIWLFDRDLDAWPPEVVRQAVAELESRFGPCREIAWQALAASPRPPATGAFLAAPPHDPGETGELRRRWGREADAAARAGLLRGLLLPAARVRVNEPMSRRTSMRVGGPAELWIEPAAEEDLRRLLGCLADWSVPWVVVGAGTNLIVSDRGIRGAAVRLSGPGFRRLCAGPAGVHAGAGVYLRHIVRAAASAGRAGLEFFEGIPGTVGGALRMNAGSMGHDFFETVERVRCLDRLGRVQERAGTEIETGYRSCPFFEEHLGLHVWFRTRPGVPAEIGRCIGQYAARRRRTQPAGPSAGCVFRNPPGHAAGKLIDETGLKGEQVGGARVSPVHANFILNEGGARAADVVALIRRIQAQVRAAKGIELEPEVVVIGEGLASDSSPPASPAPGPGGGR